SFDIVINSKNEHIYIVPHHFLNDTFRSSVVRFLISERHEIRLPIEVINRTMSHSRVFLRLSHNDATAPSMHGFFLFVKVGATDVFRPSNNGFIGAFQTPAAKINGGKKVIVAVSMINKWSLYGAAAGMVVGCTQFALLLR